MLKFVRALSLAASALTFAACGPPEEPGARIFRKKCSACHGPDGSGRTKFAQGRPYSDLTDGVWKHGGDYDSIRRLIAEGDPKSPMPAFQERLTTKEIDAVAHYVEALAQAGRAKNRRP